MHLLVTLTWTLLIRNDYLNDAVVSNFSLITHLYRMGGADNTQFE